jgi:hypothetical protein
MSNAESADDWFIDGAQIWLSTLEENPSVLNAWKLSPDNSFMQLDIKAYTFANFTFGFTLGMLKQGGFPQHFPCEKKFKNVDEVINNLAFWMQRNSEKVNKLQNSQIIEAMLRDEYSCFTKNIQ